MPFDLKHLSLCKHTTHSACFDFTLWHAAISLTILPLLEVPVQFHLPNPAQTDPATDVNLVNCPLVSARTQLCCLVPSDLRVLLRRVEIFS